MKLQSVKREIEKRGGTSTISKTLFTGFHATGNDYKHKLIGELNGYDIEMDGNGLNGEESSYFVIRPISKRGEYDPSSDYNPSGYTFCNRIKELDWTKS